MPDDVLDKIKYLCRAIPKVEWSGILLYVVEGSIRKPEKMRVVLKDIIPMNKGDQTYTEYSFNEKKRDTSGYEDRMIDYFNDNPEALEEDWKIGHIHSHNSMNVFFSGTDMAELNDNSPSHNFYLSLIVNNWMDFCAKISFVASVDTKIKEPYYAYDENGDKYELGSSEFSVKKDKLYIHDCDINSPLADKLLVDDSFAISVNSIIKKAEKPKAVVTKSYTSNKSNVPVVNKQVNGFTNTNFKNQKPKQKATDVVRDFVSDIPFADLDNMGFGSEPLSDIEEFAISLLRGTNPSTDDVCSVELALEELNVLEEDFTPEDLSKSIMDNYPALFEKMFENDTDDDHFVEVSEEVINIFEDFEGNYPFLSNTIMSLKYMVFKFEENATTV